MQQYRVNFDTISWQTPVAGVRFKAHERAGIKLRLAEFGKDFIEPDWCTKGHVGYILEGQLEIDFSGNAVSFKPGDGIFIPQGKKHKHKAKVLTDTVKVILVEDAQLLVGGRTR